MYKKKPTQTIDTSVRFGNEKYPKYIVYFAIPW